MGIAQPQHSDTRELPNAYDPNPKRSISLCAGIGRYRDSRQPDRTGIFCPRLCVSTDAHRYADHRLNSRAHPGAHSGGELVSDPHSCVDRTGDAHSEPHNRPVVAEHQALDRIG
jgi:hypothetical protein